MSAMYHSGMDTWDTWTTSGYTWLLLQSAYVPDIHHATIADVAAHEVTVAGYVRQPLTGAARGDTVTYYQGIAYGAIPPGWGGLAAGQWITTLVLARDDDVLVAWWGLNTVTDVGNFSVNFDPWVDSTNAPLPGDPNTRLIHMYETAVP